MKLGYELFYKFIIKIILLNQSIGKKPVFNNNIKYDVIPIINYFICICI